MAPGGIADSYQLGESTYVIWNAHHWSGVILCWRTKIGVKSSRNNWIVVAGQVVGQVVGDDGHDRDHDSGKDGHGEPGKVARELVGEAPDVRQLLVVHITEPGDICALITRFWNLPHKRTWCVYLVIQFWKVTMLWRFSVGRNERHCSFSPIAFKALLTRIVSTWAWWEGKVKGICFHNIRSFAHPTVPTWAYWKIFLDKYNTNWQKN